MKLHTEQLTGHDYDGIQEYDNPTPGWWNWIFAATIVFGFAYLYLSLATPVTHQWQQAQLAEFNRIFGKLGELKPDQSTIVTMMQDPQMMAIAKGTFEVNCTACHARDGGGITGPNMTDDSYKNVRALEDIYTTITKGAASGAMPAWENRMSANERIIVAGYVATLRGTTPAKPKAAEGSPIEPWPVQK